MANDATTASVTAGSSHEYTRLHITPFDEDLLKVVIPSAVLPKARNVSFHTIETFPEKRYGFVDLPEADAEKIKKRLAGAVLKGSKMRIEKARPEEDHLAVVQAPETGKKRKKDSKHKEERSKKQKHDHNLVEGVELRDRKVKRGWTVPEEAKIREKKSKKDKEKKEKKDKKDKHKKREERSKYTDKEECLLKVKLPAKPQAPMTDGDEDAERKKRKKNKSREVIVHEFEKTTKFPTFLKATKPAPIDKLTSEFIEGKGWVDAEGNVVEPAKKRRTAAEPGPEQEKKTKKKKVVKAPTPPPQEDDTTSSSGTSSEEDTSSDDGSDDETERAKQNQVTPSKKQPEIPKPAPPVEDDSTSSSGTSDDTTSEDDSDSDSDDEMEDADKAVAPHVLDSPLAALKAADASRPRSSGSNVSLTIKIPTPSTPAKVHPLEALYKRPKPDDNSTPNPVKEAEPFSFFGAGRDDDLEEEEEAAAAPFQLPMTPFTKEEFEWRNVRSAAPTPDTAHPNRTKPFWAIGTEDDEEEEEEATEEIQATLNEGVAGEGSGPGADFQKWFWDNRRNVNQSWMKRRKTAAKEKRHKDNKSRAKAV